MAAVSSAGQLQLIERAEVHKSCKALELVANLFNDYCQAANAAAQLQKKLAKALKDAATCKATSEPPFNALNAAALIFDTLSDIDNKFGRVLDKECDSLSNDLRKWFKKLAKEEKAHDDRIQAVNNKIKAAGQAYEKKSKKKAVDAVDEHTKYMNLLTVVGPEMAQDKQNHASFVTHRHNAAVCGVAASLARAADAEWQRSCEGVRRFSPNIGAVGEWRAYCEGEWSGPIPADLPNPDGDEPLPVDRRSVAPQDTGAAAFAHVTAALQTNVARQDSQPESPVNARAESSANTTTTRDSSTSASAPAPRLPSYGSYQPPPPPPPPQLPASFEQQAPPFPKPQTPELVPLTRAATFADTLPPPATTRPAPSPATAPSSPAAPAPPTPSSKPATTTAATAKTSPMTLPPPAPSVPLPASAPTTPNEFTATPVLTPAATEEARSPRTPFDSPEKGKMSASGVGLGLGAPQDFKKPLNRTLSPPPAFGSHASDRTLLDSPAPPKAMSPPPRRADYMEDRERERKLSSPTTTTRVQTQMTGIGAGVHQIQQHPTGGNVGAGGVNRRTSVDSTASGSIVAAMRDRYAERGPPPVPASPPPRDLPRLSHSVNDMATRWNPIDSPAPRRPGVNTAAGLERETFPNSISESPQNERGARPQSIYAQQMQLSQSQAAYDRYPAAAPGPGPDWENSRERRRQHLQQELQALDTEEQLRDRERELERRAAELQQERQRLATMRGGPPDDSGYRSSSRANSYQAQQPQAGYMRPPSSSGSAYGGASSQRSVSPQPGAQLTSYPSYTSSASSNGGLAAPPRNAGHAPNCGCYECSGKHYSNPPSPAKGAPMPLPTLNQTTGKKAGWMRRLSMPVVGGAFSDSKKTPTGPPLTGAATMVLPSPDERVAKRSFDKDGVGSFGHRRDNYAAANSMRR